MPKANKPKPLRDYTLAVVDSETTGLDCDRHEIIELAVILYDQQKDKVIKKWSRKAAPTHIKTASKVALEINGYNKNPNSYQDDIKDVITEFSDLIKNTLVVGQNIPFDLKFISKYYNKFNIKEDIRRSIELSSVAWPLLIEGDATKMSLESLCDHFNISNKDSHRALVDCERTLEVYRCLINTYRELWAAV